MEHKSNDWVRSKINFLVGPQEPLLATVKRRKLAWFWRVTRHNSLFKTILQGALKYGLGEAVVTCDMPEPCKFPSLDSSQKRFL